MLVRSRMPPSTSVMEVAMRWIARCASCAFALCLLFWPCRCVANPDSSGTLRAPRRRPGRLAAQSLFGAAGCLRSSDTAHRDHEILPSFVTTPRNWPTSLPRLQPISTRSIAECCPRMCRQAETDRKTLQTAEKRNDAVNKFRRWRKSRLSRTRLRRYALRACYTHLPCSTRLWSRAAR